MTIAELIAAEGGPAAFARTTRIPLRTVEDWKAGRRKPPAWLVPILADWLGRRAVAPPTRPRKT